MLNISSFTFFEIVTQCYNENIVFFTVCKILNMTGLMIDCSTECCEGDLCNGLNGAVRISGVLSSFAAILLALVLSLFPGVY